MQPTAYGGGEKNRRSPWVGSRQGSMRVICVPDATLDSVFVITAYQLGPKALRTLRSRRWRGR